jgi:hypothetical protein
MKRNIYTISPQSNFFLNVRQKCYKPNILGCLLLMTDATDKWVTLLSSYLV